MTSHRKKAMRPQGKTSYHEYVAGRYGLTPERLNRILRIQDGRCGICRRKLPYRLAVDHDHKANKVLGLLCRQCKPVKDHIVSTGLSPLEFFNRLGAISLPSRRKSRG